MRALPRTQATPATYIAPSTSSRCSPAGTIGTVIEIDNHSALIEISDERGHALDSVSLPHDALTASGENVSRTAS